MKYLILLASLLMSSASFAAERPDPSDLNVGKPDDISQELFVVVRKKCIKEWPDDFSVREYCERKQFDAIRKLRGEGNERR
jgi:hypothetical protein